MTGQMPKVGDLATLAYPSDLYPYVVTAVSPTGAKVTLEELEWSGLRPTAYHGPFPLYDHKLSADAARSGRVVVAHRGARGYAVGGYTPVIFGVARYRRDFAD